MTVAVLSAMAQEQRALLAHLHAPRVERVAARDVHIGTLAGRAVVLGLSGIGKVAAAATAALVLERFGPVEALVFTGVAGGLGEGVGVGHVVIASELLQHDLDASPLFPRYEVPLAGRARFACDGVWTERLVAAARHLAHPVHRGLIVSGDQFVGRAAQCADLRQRLPDALAVEMEGAAVAQVCHDFGVPCAVLRTISDRADDDAHVDFLRFVQDVAADVSHRVVLAALADHGPSG